jgi:hypothetical protein
MDPKQQPIERYQGDSLAQPMWSESKQLQNSYSPCGECSSIHQARAARSAYDQYMLQFYNNKAQNTFTDLHSLQFAS